MTLTVAMAAVLAAAARGAAAAVACRSLTRTDRSTDDRGPSLSLDPGATEPPAGPGRGGDGPGARLKFKLLGAASYYAESAAAPGKVYGTQIVPR